MSGTLDTSGSLPATPENKRSSVLPSTKSGWWAIGLAAVAVAMFIILPIITNTFRETIPFTDSFWMPIIMIVFVDAAAIVSILAVWKAKERSPLSLLVLFLTLAAGLFTTMMVVGEGISGV